MATDIEQFSIKKALDVSPTAIGKSTSMFVKGAIPILLICLLGFMVYKSFFQKTNQQQIVAKKGSNVQVTQINKQSRSLNPFVEVGLEKNSDTDQDFDTYIRAGVRWKF